MSARRLRRLLLIVIAIVSIIAAIATAVPQDDQNYVTFDQAPSEATEALNLLEVKGRAPKTGYTRDQFGDGWGTLQGCDLRNVILARDLKEITVNDACRVLTGTLADPYTGKEVIFARSNAQGVQIDHVVALSDAWQKGAQLLTLEQRTAFANDPLELLAVDGAANQQKGDGDAATWLPANKAFRCEYVARQIAIKRKYVLWVTEGEKTAMQQVLATCPEKRIPTAALANS